MMALISLPTTREADSSFRLELRNLSGVPVLDVMGVVDKAAVRAIEDTASRLAKAGHYHLVLNIQKAAAANAKALRMLARLVREVRKHYGGVTLVTGLEQAGQRVSGELRALFRIAESVEDAVFRIKGVRRQAETQQPGATARLVE